MGEVNVILSNFDSTMAKMKEMSAKADIAARRIVEKGSVTIASNAKREFRARPLGSLRTSKDGKKYYDSRPPFEPRKPQPTNRSGNLRDSIKMTSSERLGFGKWQSTTGPTAESAKGYAYGARVEKLGYLYMRTGFEKSQGELRRIYEKEWGEALR